MYIPLHTEYLPRFCYIPLFIGFLNFPLFFGTGNFSTSPGRWISGTHQLYVDPMVGWWLDHPCEKYARQIGFIFPNFRLFLKPPPSIKKPPWVTSQRLYPHLQPQFSTTDSLHLQPPIVKPTNNKHSLNLFAGHFAMEKWSSPKLIGEFSRQGTFGMEGTLPETNSEFSPESSNAWKTIVCFLLGALAYFQGLTVCFGECNIFQIIGALFFGGAPTNVHARPMPIPMSSMARSKPNWSWIVKSCPSLELWCSITCMLCIPWKSSFSQRKWLVFRMIHVKNSRSCQAKFGATYFFLHHPDRKAN